MLQLSRKPVPISILLPEHSIGEKQLEIAAYYSEFDEKHQQICRLLAAEITRGLPQATSRIWHSHPVWFLEENPIVGYSRQKAGIRLMFWSGADFEESFLNVIGKKFKDASAFIVAPEDISSRVLQRCLKKAQVIQWDYRNLVKRKGLLVRLV